MITTDKNIQYVLDKDFNCLLIANTRLIEIWANSYFQDYETVKDLESVGQMGLYEAMLRFDPSKNIKFISFAKFYCKGAMLNWLSDNARTIRLPRNIAQNKEFVCTTNTISLNTPINEFGDVLSDLIRIDEPEYQNDYSIIYKAINKIKKENHQDILKMYFGLTPYQQKYSSKEISIKYNKTRQNINIIVKKVLKQLKNEIDEPTLRASLQRD